MIASAVWNADTLKGARAIRKRCSPYEHLARRSSDLPDVLFIYNISGAEKRRSTPEHSQGGSKNVPLIKLTVGNYPFNSNRKWRPV